MRDSLAGTATLLRLAIRRDRLLLPLWVIGFATLAGFSAMATGDLYPDPKSRISAAEAVNATPSMVALYGRIHDPTSLGALALFKLTAFGGAMVAVLMIVFVIRHTRAEEAEDRLELLSAGVVGRHAPLSAALVVTIAASSALGLLTSGALVAAGLPASGSLAFGLGWAASGIAFATVAAVTAQLTTGSRSATGLAMATVLVAYLLRAAGDMSEAGPNAFTWLSPIGWSQQVQPFQGDRFAVLALPMLFAAAMTVIAVALRSRRDLGAGLVADRPGPSNGALRNEWHLALRLNRGLLIAWAVAITLCGVLIGSITTTASGMLDTPAMQDIIKGLGGEQNLNDAFLAAELTIIGVIVTAFGLTVANHLRAEESNGHAEMLLATMVPRWRWASSHLLIAFGGVAALMALAGLGIGIGSALDEGTTAGLGELLAAGLARVPAAWVLTGLAMAFIGWAPQRSGLVWGVYAACIVLMDFGTLWNLPTWLLDLSPFRHAPKLPGPVEVALPVLTLTAVAAMLTAIGYLGWQRRDLAA